ncbi:MAG TPA: hypothetical protein VIC35_13860, partial [Acidimicrobiia bacterium]
MSPVLVRESRFRSIPPPGQSTRPVDPPVGIAQQDHDSSPSRTTTATQAWVPRKLGRIFTGARTAAIRSDACSP